MASKNEVVAPKTQTPEATTSALLAKLVAAQPKTSGGKPTKLGISAVAFLRYLGSQQIGGKMARQILEKVCDVTISKNTIQTQLASGKRGEKVPVLTPEQLKQLDVLIAPLVNSIK